MGLVRNMESNLNRVRVPLTRERLGFGSFLKSTFKEMNEDHVGAFAGSLTYRAIFAVLPFLTFLISLLGLFDARDFVTNILASVQPTLPEPAYEFLRTSASTLTDRERDTAFGFGAVISILVSLYGLSGAFRAVMEAMNVMYGVDDSRPFVKKYLISIGLALGVVSLLLSAATLVVAGPSIARALLGDSIARYAWYVLQWPVLVLFVLLAFAVVYYAPNVEQSFKFVTPGSLIAVALWLIFTGLFSLYVNTADFTAYGAVAGAVVFMLYIYYTSFILLLGAEMNQIVEDAHPEGKDTGKKVSTSQAAQSAT